jgi:hypothetical protein
MQSASGQTFEKDDAIGCMAKGVACTRATLKTINHPFLEFFPDSIVSNNLLIQYNHQQKADKKAWLIPNYPSGDFDAKTKFTQKTLCRQKNSLG